MGMAAKVLIIDDDPTIRRMTTTILERGNYQVQAARSVAQALEMIAEQRPDVVCCDLMMPGESGIDFLEYRRQSPDLADIPVIVISAVGEERMIRKARALGAFDCLAKPFSRNQLLSMVDSALEVARR
jgi:CheY-like chemotaxis protein